MNRCRVSEEDKTDPYFDGAEDITDPCSGGLDVRDSFTVMLHEVTALTELLFRDKNFRPDEDDIAALSHLHDELKYYEKVKKL